jgi:hypothetical protein
MGTAKIGRVWWARAAGLRQKSCDEIITTRLSDECKNNVKMTVASCEK